MALISLDNVSKIYPKGTRPALDNINLNIERGDFVFLVGASGSGKTTLLSLLLREEEATGGEIRVAGNDLRRIANRQVPQYRRSLGFVFQDYKLLNNKTVWENVAFALEVIGTRRSTIKSLVPKVLDTVGLTGKEKNYPHELSGGEQQRVAIARAYVNHPQILLADEPTGNLDPTTSLGIMEVLDAINRTGTTVVMATHNEEIVNSMRKRVIELHNGKIVRDEAHGSYDSALYFPDAQVEAKSGAANHMLPSVSVADDPEGPSEGIARLANSVHSGRTGRYGETFAPIEDTLTWGKGIPLDDPAAAMERTQAYNPLTGESGESAGADGEHQTDDSDQTAQPKSANPSDTVTDSQDTAAPYKTETPSMDTPKDEKETAEASASTLPPAPLPPAPPAPPVGPSRPSAGRNQNTEHSQHTQEKED
ncbi:cell division ATP-binding protein FtsE [Bifidobacterium scaligerum]|uniref:Cell division ATP-binding protein FtsE n=1 Tax=Bifidobacterium scaligerum TaxID=2052656 RepID=A0A2M9HPF7_9BIFI|nr:cell division ATP-binding protein FtsE [Bifidobacterium scaligerum]PJM78708.1 cell division ATP-binding protein FtsE [Bifidobacterium scaligerum]